MFPPAFVAMQCFGGSGSGSGTLWVEAEVEAEAIVQKIWVDAEVEANFFSPGSGSGSF